MAIVKRQPFILLVALLGALLLSGCAVDGGAAFEEAQKRGPVFLALAAFGFGVLVSLTPCVYPMVAITVSVFGANQSKSRLQAFGLSGMFLLGLVAMFVPLGVAAAVTGKTFGAALSNPWVVVVLSGFFVALAASMFGAFDLDLPSGLKNRLASAGGAGYAGAFVLGMVCGPIAAPCTGPFLYAMLAWIAKTQSVQQGTIAMTTFALGLGLPFFLVGAFAVQLPKSGRWMVHIKSLMGIVLLVVAFYFLGNAFPPLRKWASPEMVFLAGAAALVLLGVALGAIHKPFEGSELGTKISKGIGVALVSVASFGFITGASTPSRTLTWEEPEQGQTLVALVDAARAKARAEDRPLFLDFTADWCGACKQIASETFPDERVQKEAGRFVSVKMDMTDMSNPSVERAFEEFAIVGLPTMILFDSSGKEVHRFKGDFVTAERLVEVMSAVN